MTDDTQKFPSWILWGLINQMHMQSIAKPWICLATPCANRRGMNKKRYWALVPHHYSFMRMRCFAWHISCLHDISALLLPWVSLVPFFWYPKVGSWHLTLNRQQIVKFNIYIYIYYDIIIYYINCLAAEIAWKCMNHVIFRIGIWTCTFPPSGWIIWQNGWRMCALCLAPQGDDQCLPNKPGAPPPYGIFGFLGVRLQHKTHQKSSKHRTELATNRWIPHWTGYKERPF
jgi:hypothetical protein